MPMAPGAVVREFGAGVDEDDAWGIGEFDEADGETHGSESGAGKGDVVCSAAVPGGGAGRFDAGDGAATGECHKWMPTRLSRWR